MIFVFGGAHQGMEAYAIENCGAREIRVLTEENSHIDFSGDGVTGLERFVLGCVQRDESALAYFEAHRDEWENSVLIGMDFSCGVVPMDAQQRLWREENGRLNNYLAGEAQKVVRMFCGIAQILK